MINQVRFNKVRNLYLHTIKVITASGLPYVFKTTDKDEIKKWINGEGLALIPAMVDSINNVADATKEPYPNVYFNLYEDNKVQLGVSYDNSGAVGVFENLTSPANIKHREKMLEILKDISPEWKFCLHKKSRINYKADYQPVSPYPILCNTIDDEALNTLLDKIKSCRENSEKGTTNEKGKIIWQVPSINIMDFWQTLEINGSKNDTEIVASQEQIELFNTKMIEAFKVFIACMNIKSEKQVKIADVERQRLQARRDSIVKVLPTINDTKKKEMWEKNLKEVEDKLRGLEG